MLKTKQLCNCEQALQYKQALKDIQDIQLAYQEESREIESLFAKLVQKQILDIIEKALETEGENDYEF